MSLENFTDFKLPKNAYLSFDANSLKELIIERLNENEEFTDQNFEGSNFNAFIDVVAYMYHVLLFYLNTTSNESTFTTATIYENMSKLVSSIGYKPLGDQTSILTIDITAQNINAGAYVLPKFSFINVSGNSYYMLKDIEFEKVVDNTVETLELSNNLLHQGTLKEATFTAVGESYETITLIDSYTSPQQTESAKQVKENKFIADNTFSVYVQDGVTGNWSEWHEATSLFLEDPSSKKYEKRLNHSGNYEFKFGDSNNGRSLNEGDKVVLFYIVSDNDAGAVGANSAGNQSPVLYTSANWEAIYTDLYSDLNSITSPTLPNLLVTNEFASTPIKPAETVDQIKQTAPKIFETQDRLVNKSDYESHINRHFGNVTRNVKVLSNEDYTSQVLFYYNNIGVKRGIDDTRTLLAQVNFSTSTNFNNIYVYTVRTNQPIINETVPNYLNEGQKRLIIDYCNQKKDITHNVIISDPIFKAFSFGVGEITDSSSVDNILRESGIRVTVDRNIAVSDASIKTKIATIFKVAFSSLDLGSLVDISQISKDILNIDGIEGLETVNGNNVTPNLSFIIWNPDYRDIDSVVLARDYKLKNFEYAYFYQVSDITNKITIRRV